MRILLFCLSALVILAQNKAPKDIGWYKSRLERIEKKPTDNFCKAFDVFLEYKELHEQFLKAKLYNPLIETTLSSHTTLVGRKASALGVQEFRTKGEVSCIEVYGPRDVNHVIKPFMDMMMLEFVRKTGNLTTEEKKQIDEKLGPLVVRK